MLTLIKLVYTKKAITHQTQPPGQKPCQVNKRSPKDDYSQLHGISLQLKTKMLKSTKKNNENIIKKIAYENLEYSQYVTRVNRLF